MKRVKFQFDERSLVSIEPMEKAIIDPKRIVKATQSFSNDLMELEFADPGLCEPHPEGGFFTHACPGCGRVGGILVDHPKPTQSPSWDIVGGCLTDVTTLSLSPSIHCKGCCGWHGHLKNGVFESC